MVNQTTLKLLIGILKENQVRCGIGGSYLLQIYKLYDDPDDVDFWVAPDDMEKVRCLFGSYEQVSEKIQLPAKYHMKIRFQDIDADFVACFMTRPNKNEYVYNISPDNVTLIETEDGSMLPCTSLEDWFIVYKLLKREDKASIIRNFIFHKNALETNEKLESILRDDSNKLPKKMKEDIYEFMTNNIQISLEDLYGNMEDSNE